MGARDIRMGVLFDYLVAEPDGVTITQIESHLECSRKLANQAVRDLRIWCGDDDSMNVDCEQQGHRQRWLYKFVANWGDIKGWELNRLLDLVTRIETMRAVIASIDRGTDARTYDGKRSRIFKRHLLRMIEDLESLQEEIA